MCGVCVWCVRYVCMCMVCMCMVCMCMVCMCMVGVYVYGVRVRVSVCGMWLCSCVCVVCLCACPPVAAGVCDVCCMCVRTYVRGRVICVREPVLCCSFGRTYIRGCMDVSAQCAPHPFPVVRVCVSVCAPPPLSRPGVLLCHVCGACVRTWVRDTRT